MLFFACWRHEKAEEKKNTSLHGSEMKAMIDDFGGAVGRVIFVVRGLLSWLLTRIFIISFNNKLIHNNSRTHPVVNTISTVQYSFERS